MRYDIEADWQLLNTCNYRCDYCFFPDQVLGEKTVRHASPDEWAGAFSGTGRTWLLHLTGGEPSAYPDFVDLCAALTRHHFISLNSNLTQKSLADFVRRIDPARVSFINAGLHPDERSRLARAAYGGWRAARPEPPTIDPFEDDAFLTDTLDFRGRTCAAGSRFVRIEPQGDVFRCGSDTAMQGNILNRTFAPLRRPSPCNSGYCFYFCRKYTDPQYTGARVTEALPGGSSLVPPHLAAGLSAVWQRLLGR